MRLVEEIDCSGVFWLPDHNTELTGQLHVQDGGRTELELVGLFGDEFHEAFESGEIPRILGQVEKLGFVTLENCIYLNKSVSFGGISKSRILANELFVGAVFNANEAERVLTYAFTIEGFDEWVRRSGISVRHSFEAGTATIDYSAPEELVFDLGSTTKLVFTHSWTLPGSEIITSAQIRHKNYLELRSSEPVPLGTLRQFGHRINTFFSLVIDQNVTIQEVTITSSELYDRPSSDNMRPARIRLYFQALSFSKKPPKTEYFNMLFLFPKVRDRFQDLIVNWLAAYESIAPAMDLYFSTKNDGHRYLEGRFLALSQGVESFHRRTSQEKLMPDAEFEQLRTTLVSGCPKENREWLQARIQHGNELSFAKRLLALFADFEQLFGGTEKVKRLVRNIVDTRNYLTHYDRALEGRAVTGKALWHLCQKMDALFQILLLRTTGFLVDEVAVIVGQSNRFQYRLRDDL